MDSQDATTAAATQTQQEKTPDFGPFPGAFGVSDDTVSLADIGMAGSISFFRDRAIIRGKPMPKRKGYSLLGGPVGYAIGAIVDHAAKEQVFEFPYEGTRAKMKNLGDMFALKLPTTGRWVYFMPSENIKGQLVRAMREEFGDRIERVNVKGGKGSILWIVIALCMLAGLILVLCDR